MFDLAKLKICFVAGTLGQGGAERQLYHIVKALKESSVAVRLLCLTRGEFWEQKIRDLGVSVEWIGQHGSKAGRAAQLIHALRDDMPDVLQSQHFYTNLYVALAARVLGIRDIGAIRNDCSSEVEATGRVMGRLSLRAPRSIAANSRVAISNAQALGIRPERLHLLSNVVDTERFKPDLQRTSRVVKLLAVGRLVEQKRMDRFLALAARLKKQSSVPIRAVVVGDGPLRTQLERHSLELGLSPDDVEFRGTVSDMSPFYRESDILILTSDWEGTPNVVLEAMASGMAVVATRVGGLPEIVRHAETGYLVDATDAEAMVASVLGLVNDACARREVGRRARNYIAANHSSSGLAERLAGFYRVVLS